MGTISGRSAAIFAISAAAVAFAGVAATAARKGPAVAKATHLTVKARTTRR